MAAGRISIMLIKGVPGIRESGYNRTSEPAVLKVYRADIRIKVVLMGAGNVKSAGSDGVSELVSE